MKSERVQAQFYVADRWEDWERAASVIKTLTSHGFTCAHDWTVAARDFFIHGKEEEDMANSALCDLEGASTSNVLLLIACGKGGQGRWFEWGVAYQAGVPVVAWVDDDTKLGVFFHLPGVQIVRSREDAIKAAIQTMALGLMK